MFKTIVGSDRDEARLRQRSVSIGAALFILGITGCVALVLIDKLSTAEISIAMLAAGVLQVSHALAAHRRGWPTFTVIAALLYLCAALAILFQPLVAMEWIELILVGSLAMAGISRLATAARLDASLRGWEALSGLTTLGVAAAIGAGLPEMSLWPLGFAIALDLIVEGGALANIGWAMPGARDR
ncbi:MULTISPECIES: hypothetical protein [unclassified Sphingomonas]|uniref:hypothetical protein n=1 Tax=unclassified Sphingomonas TaxID=196159 RepID=UPI0006FE4541|nr:MULTISPECIES: hypothetical protein [unclassified Sphingomonas]KQX23301.1 hypothetical protein ASD17_03015 [Sphingomonas sp. Root1294]KQY68149.1 hypothetical protein ASD39_05535 [Sphingomonas sp. Root50]KRB91042.1 hypothetical protein ASE22_12330 [Sphingomonas sp. Root720]